MSLYLFDTDTLTLFERMHPLVLRNVFHHLADDIRTTSVTVEEQLGGWFAMNGMSPRDVPPPRVPALVAGRAPFFYGWVVLGVLCCAGFARQGPAVATLSVFVTPLIHDFGWSRTALSGAVSLGGILAAIVSPAIGPFLDRAGSRLVLCYAILTTGVALLLL